LTSIYGSNLAPAQEHAGILPLPLSMQGVSVTVNGVSAPLLDVLASQINFQIPYETGAGPALVAVNNSGQVTTFPIVVSVAAPGLWNYFISLSGIIGTSAKSGDVLTTFMTGEGAVTPNIADGDTAPPGTSLANLPHARLPITITVNGQPATVLFAAIPEGLTGVTQINMTLPRNLPTGPVEVIVSVGGVPAQARTLLIN
jgi:uncharacterized protein (TIGR03437 family)